jgi:hypothetical protein
MVTDSVSDFFMPDENKQITRIDLQPEEIIRILAWRSRICRYIIVVAAVWLIVAAVVHFVWLGFESQNTKLNMISFVLQMVGCGTLSVAFAVQFAIYRCPVCDKFLNRLSPDKRHCPQCNAQVRESK